MVESDDDMGCRWSNKVSVVTDYVIWDTLALEGTSDFILRVISPENLLEDFEQGSSMT